jgi:hypothetical protein
MVSLILGSNEFDLESLAGLVGYDGWGMAPVVRFARRGAQQHGDSDAGYLLEPRFGNLVFRLRETSLAGMYALRQRLLKLFAPGNSGSLRFDLPDGGKRQFDVVYAGDLSMGWDVKDWAAQKVVVTLRAADPTAYDPVVRSVNFSLAVSAGWAVPWEVPWAVGDGSFDDAVDVGYEGDFDSYPVVNLIGPITDAVILNETTGDKLDFTGTTIGAGDVYTVDCRWGYKTVRDGAGVNQISKLSSDSDLATFGLVASQDGNEVNVNRIRVTGSGGNSFTNVTLSYYVRFLGV